MNILNVNATLDPVTGGGTAERTFQMSLFMEKIPDVNVTILTLNPGPLSEQREKLINVKLVTLPCINKRFYFPFSVPGNIKELVSQADIIHIMGHWTIINLIVYYHARMMKKPYVVCPAGALPLFGRSKLLKRLYNIFGGKSLVKNAVKHIAITQDEVDCFLSYGVSVDSIEIIPNGIDPENYKFIDDLMARKHLGLPEAPFILFVGRLNLIKGPDLLLQAFSNLHDNFTQYNLVFAGPDGGMLPELKSYVEKHELQSQVHFVGYVGGELKSALYHAADILVIPSRQEAMSIVVLEAGISRIPVLLTEECGFDEVNKIGGGEVVPATVNGVQSGLLNMLSDSKGFASKGIKLHDYIYANYTWDIVVRKYIDLYSKIV